MANSVTLRKLVEGPKHLVVMAKFNIDTTAEMTDTLFVDPNGSGTCDPVPIMPAAAAFSIEEIWSSVSSMAVVLEFDATTDTPAWVITAGAGNDVYDFREFGGIKDGGGTGATGKIQMTTIGATANVSTGVIILKLRKN